MQFERDSYQAGSLRKVTRKKGPAVWEYRFRDHTRPGSPMKQLTLSTIEFPTEAKARIALQQKVMELNGSASFKQRHVVTMGNLIDRFKQEERIEEIATQKTGMARNDDGLQYSTALSYRSMLEKHIRPYWQEAPLASITPLAVDRWLRGLTRLEDGQVVPVSPRQRGISRLSCTVCLREPCFGSFCRLRGIRCNLLRSVESASDRRNHL